MKNYFLQKLSNVPIYKGKLLIIFSNDIHRANKRLNKFFSEDEEEIFAHAGRSGLNGYKTYVVIINFHSRLGEITHGIITHESIHAANFILDDCDVVPDYDNDEPLTYLAEWITDKIYDFIKQAGFKVN